MQVFNPSLASFDSNFLLNKEKFFFLNHTDCPESKLDTRCYSAFLEIIGKQVNHFKLSIESAIGLDDAESIDQWIKETLYCEQFLSEMDRDLALQSAFHYAISKKKQKAFDLFLEYSFGQKLVLEKESLDTAFRFGSVNIVKQILSMDNYKLPTDYFSSIQKGDYFFFDAVVKEGDIALIKLLFEKAYLIKDKHEEVISHIFFNAIKSGHLDLLKELVNQGASAQITNHQGKTGLIIASEKSDLKMVDFFIDNGVKLEHFDHKQRTALMAAAEKGHLEVIKLLIKKGARIEQVRLDGSTPLIAAAEKGYLEVVKFFTGGALKREKATALVKTAKARHAVIIQLLIKKSVKIDEARSDGATALIRAAEKGHLEVVKLLLNQGANIYPTRSSGKTALAVAMENGHKEIADFLKYKTAASNKLTINFLDTIYFDCFQLFIAEIIFITIIWKNKKIARFLNRIKIDLKDHAALRTTSLLLLLKESTMKILQLFMHVKKVEKTKAQTLVEAVDYGQIELVKKFASFGDGFNQPDLFGITPLIHAVMHNKPDIIGSLINVGANVNYKNFLGISPLIVATRYGLTESIKALFYAGADINQADIFGSTPLMIAATYNQKESLKYLISCGVNLDQPDMFGTTALMIASKKGYLDIMEILISKGSDLNRKNKIGFSVFKTAFSKELYSMLLAKEMNLSC